jgi:hypothetical protein
MANHAQFIPLIQIHRTKALKGGKSFDVTAELKKPSQSVIVIITSVSIDKPARIFFKRDGLHSFLYI